MRTKEGKNFSLVLEHTMDMKENPFHYRFLRTPKYRWKKGVKKFKKKV